MITSGSLKVDARSSTPLFHVHPKGCPSIAQMKIGLFPAAATAWASSRDVFHGIVRQASSPDGCNCRCRVSKSPAVRLLDAVKRRLKKSEVMKGW